VEELQRLMKSGEYLQATRRFDQVIRSGQLGVRQLARTYRLASTAYYCLGEVFTARELARKAEGLAQEAGDVELTLRVWSDLIELERVAGDSSQALAYGMQWMEMHDQHFPGHEACVGEVHYNLGLVYRLRRDPKTALQHFSQAADYLSRQADLTFHLMSLQMAAWTHYEQGELAQGDSFLVKAQGILEETPSDREAIKEQVLLRALRAHSEGNYGQAAALSEEVLADPHISGLQAFWANWLAASCAVNSHSLAADPALAARVKESALYFSSRALDLATTLKRGDLMNKASTIRRLVSQLPNASDQAG
jgi:tetratricopeptide (TPR) repeat protein